MSIVREKILKQDDSCCVDGKRSYMDLEHAALLQGESGFEDLTDDVIAYREQRCRVADGCQYSKTGRCALEAAGMISTYPDEYKIEE